MSICDPKSCGNFNTGCDTLADQLGYFNEPRNKKHINKLIRMFDAGTRVDGICLKPRGKDKEAPIPVLIDNVWYT